MLTKRAGIGMTASRLAGPGLKEREAARKTSAMVRSIVCSQGITTQRAMVHIPMGCLFVHAEPQRVPFQVRPRA